MAIKLASPTTLLILIILLLPLAAAATAPPQQQPSSPDIPVKPNCRRRTCGNLGIPWPFGVEKDCYIHQDFDIECDESVNPPRAILRSVKMEVLDIPLDYSGIVVKGPVISSNCSRRKTGQPVGLAGSPFFFSYRSMFTFVSGCDEDAWMPEAGGTAFTGCHTTCGHNESKNFGSSAGPAQGNTVCSGNYCCQTPIYSTFDLRDFNVKFEKGEGEGEGCKWAFLAEYRWFNSNIKDRRSLEDIGEYVPLVLFWLLDEHRNWNYNENTTICGDTNFLNSTTTMRMECLCNNVTYKGNPYLGCQDIDECEDPKLHSCHGLTKCVNVKGASKCEINKRF